jgi:hypothetical protein
MRDDVGEIDEDPSAVVVALGARNVEPVLFRGVDDRVGDRTRLNFRAARDDDERIGDGGPALEI